MTASCLAVSAGRAPSLLRRPVASTRLPRRAPATTRRGTVVRAAWGQLNDLAPQPEERWSSVFAPHMPATNNPASVYDARDALEACSGLWGEERRDCLGIFGVDADQVDTFYSAVFTLEQALSQDTDPEEEALHQGKERC